MSDEKKAWGMRAFLIVAAMYVVPGLIYFALILYDLVEKSRSTNTPAALGYGLAVERALVLDPAAWKGSTEVIRSPAHDRPLCDRVMLDEARVQASRGEKITCSVFKERFDEGTCGRMDAWSCAILEFHPEILGDPQIHALIVEVLWHPCDFLPPVYEFLRDVLACDSNSSVGRRIALRADHEQEVVDVRMRPEGLTRGPVLP